MKGFLTIAGWAVVFYLLYCSVLFVAQRWLMFPRYLTPVPNAPQTPVAGIEKLQVTVSGGTIEAWFLPPRHLAPGDSAPAIIFAHGNVELIDYLSGEFDWLPEKGVGVLLVEYPGYGRSQGRPSQKSIVEAFTAAYDMLVERRDVDRDRIVLFGRSIGGGAVCALAGKRPSAAMILTSSFTSARFFASAYLAPGFLVLDDFDNLSTVRNYPNPVLVVHGAHDEIVPFSHGEALAQAAPQGRLISYPCGHNDCPPDWQQFREDLTTFLLEAGIINTPITGRDGNLK